MYSEKVLDHFQNPRNLGRIQEPDGEGSCLGICVPKCKLKCFKGA